MNEPALEYEPPRADPLAAKAKWVVIAAAVANVIGICHGLSNFYLYLMPKLFTSVGTSMADRGKTKWLHFTLALVGELIAIWSLMSAVAYLRGHRARKSLVLASWATILFSAGMMVVTYFTYRSSTSLADRMIFAVWDLGGFINAATIPTLVILFFGIGSPPSTLSELSGRVVSEPVPSPPGRTPDSPSPSH